MGQSFFLRVTDLRTGKALAHGADAALAARGGVWAADDSEEVSDVQQTTQPARSRSPRRLVNHKSPHQGVFGKVPESFEEFMKHQS